MKQWEDRYQWEWLPGYKEMMACQEREWNQTEELPEEAALPAGENRWDRENAPEDWQEESPSVGGEDWEREKSAEGWQEENPSAGEEDKLESEMGRMLLPEKVQQEEREYWEDYTYMLRMLPAAAREIWAVSDAVLDKYEFEGSSMYAQYPDKNTMLKIADGIYETLQYYETEPTETKVDGTEGKNVYYVPPEERGIHTPFRQLIFVMLCWNMAYRRQRYYRRKKIFPFSR